MTNDIIQINQSEMLQAINRSEVDIQIATAKQYPRDIARVLNLIETYATMDTETAEDCFYALRRASGGGDSAVIEGVSVRLTEIIAGAWGNLRLQTRIIGNDGRTITAQGVCHDLETNLAVSVEVKRRITDKNGRTYSEDMQVVTGNAASAIAYRNAVLKVVPKAITKSVILRIKDVALGKAIDLETSRQNALANYKKAGVSEQEILEHLEVKSITDIDKEKIFYLRSLWNGIKEGTTSIAETFKKSKGDSTGAAEAIKAASADKKGAKIEQAMTAAGMAKTTPPPASTTKNGDIAPDASMFDAQKQ